MDNTTIKSHLQDIIRQAGHYIRNSNERRATEKDGAKDFVTEADLEADRIVSEGIRSVMPDSIILSEEHPEKERRKMFDASFTGFVVDPIDGTYNFKRNLHQSATSIGYIENGEPAVGVIYDPYRDELYTAIKGSGAFCNDKPIQVSQQHSLASALVATDNNYNDAAMARTLRRQLAIYEQTNIMPWLSCIGSGVLALAYVACGRFDAYHHNGLKPWDNAAGFLLVREAGGVVRRFDGTDAAFTDAAIIAGTPPIATELQQIFTHIDATLKLVR